MPPVLHAHTASPHGASTIPTPVETSVFPTWLRYSATGSGELTGFPMGDVKVNQEISRLAERIRPALAGARNGQGVIDTFRQVLLKEEGFQYDRVAGNPENFLVGGVLARKRGNCLGMSLLWLSLAERLDLPFRGVYVPGHCFVRYVGDGAPVNVEFSDGGAPWEDARYRMEFRLSERGPYLRTLSPAEMLGVFFKSLGAAYAKKGRNEEALAIYAEGERLYPGLPDGPYNAGVSLQRLGRTEEAIAKYRRALSLDPDMALARGNLGILLARKGHYTDAIAEALRDVSRDPRDSAARGNLASAYCACGNYDEGIREYLKALELDPANAAARAGLTRAYFATGSYREAAHECELAEALGCSFDPSMLEVLHPYRGAASTTGAAP